MQVCKNVCERYRKFTNKRIPYTSGLIAYCRACRYTYYKEDVPNYRCMCCGSILRTHKRTKKIEATLKRIK